MELTGNLLQIYVSVNIPVFTMVEFHGFVILLSSKQINGKDLWMNVYNELKFRINPICVPESQHMYRKE